MYEQISILISFALTCLLLHFFSLVLSRYSIIPCQFSHKVHSVFPRKVSSSYFVPHTVQCIFQIWMFFFRQQNEEQTRYSKSQETLQTAAYLKAYHKTSQSCYSLPWKSEEKHNNSGIWMHQNITIRCSLYWYCFNKNRFCFAHSSSQKKSPTKENLMNLYALNSPPPQVFLFLYEFKIQVSCLELQSSTEVQNIYPVLYSAQEKRLVKSWNVVTFSKKVIQVTLSHKESGDNSQDLSRKALPTTYLMLMTV